MELYWKAAAGILIAAVVSLALGKDMGILLCLAVCAMAGAVALEFLEPVMDLIRRLEAMASIQSGMLGILLKILGISLVSELASLICTDSGSGTLGKVIRILGNAVILWVSIPLFHAVLNVLQQIMGGI